MTAQELLTLAAETVLLSSIALYSYLFVTGLMAHHRRVSPGQLSLFDVKPNYSQNLTTNGSQTQPEQPQPPAPTEPEKPRYEVVILPFKRRVRQTLEIDLSGMTIRQLKAIASRVRLPKYNTCTKAELQARLVAEVEPDRLLEALSSLAA